MCTPVPRAVSYLLTPVPPPAASLTCDRITVIPGETIQIGPGGTGDTFRTTRQIGTPVLARGRRPVD